MNKFKVILATVAIFVSGLVAGALVMRAHMLSSDGGSRDERVKSPKFSKNMREEILERMTKDLNLGEQQRALIDGIIAEHQEQLSQIWDPVREKSDAVFASMNEEISAVLDDQQRVTFLEIVERHKRDHEERHKSREKEDTSPSGEHGGAEDGWSHKAENSGPEQAEE